MRTVPDLAVAALEPAGKRDTFEDRWIDVRAEERLRGRRRESRGVTLLDDDPTGTRRERRRLPFGLSYDDGAPGAGDRELIRGYRLARRAEDFRVL